MRALAFTTALAALVLGAAAAPARAEKLTGDGYVIEIQPPSAPRAGASARAIVHIRPTGGFHLNQEFPFKITITPGEGVKTSAKPLAKGDARHFAEDGADFDVTFSIAHPGKGELSGIIKFATCSDDTCLPHKQAFKIVATAK